MASERSPTVAQPKAAYPAIRPIGWADLKDALARGFDDFRAMPTHVIFLSLIYPIVGLLLSRLMFGYGIWRLLYPLVAGFALIGPIAALGLYELSRRRERGLAATWTDAFDVLRSPSIGAIAVLALLLMTIFFVWLAVAHALYGLAFGDADPATFSELARQVLFTPRGWWLILVGNGVGLLFAITVLAVSVVSFPLLLDRNVGATVAAVTSVRVVLANPFAMTLWGMIVAAALAIGSLPFLFGLAIVMPILGHATWHLYRKTVAG